MAAVSGGPPEIPSLAGPQQALDTITERSQGLGAGERGSLARPRLSQISSVSHESAASSDSIVEDAFANAETPSKHKSTLRSFGSKRCPDCENDSDVLDRQIQCLEHDVSEHLHHMSASANNASSSRFGRCCRFKFSGPSNSDVHWIHTASSNTFFGLVIVCNAVFMGLETDLKTPVGNDSLESPQDEDLGTWLFWFLVESIFLSIFTFELLLRVRASGCMALRDPWNAFDLVLVSLGIMDTWCLHFVLRDNALSVVTLLRVVRLVRLIRVLRILRLFRFIHELTLLAQGIIGACRALGWSLLLITIVLYISAVFVTTLFGETEDEHISEWFGSLGSSLLTLFQLMTLEDWPVVVRRVKDRWGLSIMFFVPFIALTNFVLLNVITGVIVERVLTCADDQVVSEANRSARVRLSAMRALTEIFKDMDVNRTNELDEAQFMKAIANPLLMKRFYELGFAKYEVEHLFSYMEVADKLMVPIPELVEGCLKIHGPAQSKHLLQVQYDVLRNGKEIRTQVMKLNKQVKWIIHRLERMDNGNNQKAKCSQPQTRCCARPPSPAEQDGPSAPAGPARLATECGASLALTLPAERSQNSAPPTASVGAPPPRKRSFAAQALHKKLGELARNQALTRKLVEAYSQEVSELRFTVSEFVENRDHRCTEDSMSPTSSLNSCDFSNGSIASLDVPELFPPDEGQSRRASLT